MMYLIKLFYTLGNYIILELTIKLMLIKLLQVHEIVHIFINKIYIPKFNI